MGFIWSFLTPKGRCRPFALMNMIEIARMAKFPHFPIDFYEFPGQGTILTEETQG